MKCLLLALSLIFPALSWAQPQRYQLEPVAFRDFSGGLNDAQDASAIDRKDAYDILNTVIDDPIGSLVPRNGFTQCGILPGGNTGKGIYEYSKADGTRRLIVTNGSTYWQTPDCVSFTTIVTAHSTTSLPSFGTIRDKLWAVNGTTFAWTWTGSAYSLLDGGAGKPNPAPPRGAYISFWQERVWIARTKSNPSALQFSALTMSNGDDVDPSTSSVAWPATNVLYVDQGGGCPIYGIKTYRNNLYVHKGECGIWRIIFNNDFDIAIVKTLAKVGTRFNDSIIELDDLQYFVGPDGIYAFDGDRTSRVSEKIPNRFKALRQPLSNEAFKTWTVAGDFDDGTFSSATEISIAGSVSLSSTVVQDDFVDGDLTGGPLAWTGSSNWSVSGGRAVNSSGSGAISADQTTSTGAFTFRLTVNPTVGNNVAVKFISAGADYSAHAGYAILITQDGSSTADITLREFPAGNDIATVSGRTYNETGNAPIDLYKVVRTTGGVFSVYQNDDLLYTGTDTTVNTSSKIVVNCGAGNCYFDDLFIWRYAASGTWASEDYNAGTAISSWTTFDANHAAAGGSVGYEIRLATNSDGLVGASYTSIVPGSIINSSSINVRAQVRVTLTRAAGDFSVTPELYNATINWSEGELSNQSIYGLSWDNRFYLSAASGTSSDNNVVLVKARSPLVSWVPYDWQIGAMTRYNDNFYALASTHSAIYRMDYGEDDNGAAFTWHWTSKAESWDDWTRQKRLLEVQADFRRNTASNMEIAFSSNTGTNWETRTIDMSGSGRDSTRQFVHGYGLDWMFRILNRTRGERATVLGITPWARKEVYRQ